MIWIFEDSNDNKSVPRFAFPFSINHFLAVNFSEWITPHRYLIHEPCFIDLLHHFNNAALTSKIWSQEGLSINRSQINKFLRFPFLNHSSIFTRRFTFAKWTMRRNTGLVWPADEPLLPSPNPAFLLGVVRIFFYKRRSLMVRFPYLLLLRSDISCPDHLAWIQIRLYFCNILVAIERA